MADYKRAAFNQEWWDKVKEFLEENPQVGFEPDDVKQFIKFAVKKEMNSVQQDRDTLEELLREIREEK